MGVWVNVRRWAMQATRGVTLLAIATSVSGCIDDFDDPKGYGADGTGGRSGSNRGGCLDACERLAACDETDELACKRQCVAFEDIVESAGCSEEYGDLIQCFSREQNICGGFGGCEGPSDRFVGCLSRYCGEDFERCPL